MNAVKRIHLCGPHASGKSTILRELTDMTVGYEVVDADRWYYYSPTYYNSQVDRIGRVFAEINTLEDGRYFVDRSVHDTLVYSRLLTMYGKLTEHEWASIRLMASNLPASYLHDAFHVVLLPDTDRVIENVKERDREAHDIMNDENFIRNLIAEFRAYFNVLSSFQNVLLVTGEYDSSSILNALERNCWVQHYEIKDEYRLHEFGI